MLIRWTNHGTFYHVTFRWFLSIGKKGYPPQKLILYIYIEYYIISYYIILYHIISYYYIYMENHQICRSFPRVSPFISLLHGIGRCGIATNMVIVTIHELRIPNVH